MIADEDIDDEIVPLVAGLLPTRDAVSPAQQVQVLAPKPKRMSLAEMRSMKQARQARIQRTISAPIFASDEEDDVRKNDQNDSRDSRDTLTGTHSLDTRRVHFLDEVTSSSQSAPTTALTTPTTTENGPVDTAAAAATSTRSNVPSGKPLGKLFSCRGLHGLLVGTVFRFRARRRVQVVPSAGGGGCPAREPLATARAPAASGARQGAARGVAARSGGVH